MRFHDSAIGAVLIAFGVWIAWTASGFPKLTGQPIGPGTFPVVLGTLCALGGAVIAIRGARAGGPLVDAHPGWRRRDRQATAVVMIAGSGILAVWFEEIGFVLGGSVLLAALFFASGKRHPVWIGVGVAFVTLVHLSLTRFLNVPLPAGPLKGLL
ncbi:tripartite tricarboxylate transporter TctB family protein [Litorisediminicola beolgyonensis]|uniref:Tripartite tricarboxylate transporter TctB family protein n=1 Tax=Litorisediminicola beolgyonensis TaxID=1173614 RepID=A0ABW3ZIZ2_9RHOB